MTLRAFKDGLNAVNVTGVQRYTDEINLDVAVADLPFQYVRLPVSDFTEWTYGKIAPTPTRSAELVILVRPVVMGTNEQNHDDMITIADDVIGCLESGVTGVHIETINQALDMVNINGTDYHAVVTTVTGRG